MLAPRYQPVDRNIGLIGMSGSGRCYVTWSTASLIAGEYPPPMDMVTTAGRRCLCSRTRSKGPALSSSTSIWASRLTRWH